MYRKCWLNACWNHLISLRKVVSLLRFLYVQVAWRLKMFLEKNPDRVVSLMRLQVRQQKLVPSVPHSQSLLHPRFPPSRQWRRRCVTPSSLPLREQAALCCWVTVSSCRGYVVWLESLWPWPGSGNTKWDTNVYYHSSTAHFGTQTMWGFASSKYIQYAAPARMFFINSVCRVRLLLWGKLFFPLLALQKYGESDIDYPYTIVDIASSASPQMKPKQTQL